MKEKVRPDYEVLHYSGQKVREVSESEIEKLASDFENICMMPSIDKLWASEREIRRDVNGCMDQNDLDQMLDSEMINDYIQELTSIYRTFLDIHDDLQDALGTDEHKKLFPKYREDVDGLNSNIRKAKSTKYRAI